MHLARKPFVLALIAVGLGVVVVIQLVPFYVAVTTALKPMTDLSSQLLPPTSLYPGNFVSALGQGNILRALLNSIIITGASTVLVCLVGALAAYPLARRLTRLNKVVALLIISLIMIPPLSILVPLYSMLNQLHGVNTYWGEILVMVTGQLPLSIFLFSSFLRTIPVSLEEAATIDGASLFQVLFQIVFPLLKPVTATVAILAGVAIWNEYALSVYILTDPSVQTIAPAISTFFSQQSSNLGAAAAASLVAVVPVLVAYLFLQKFFMKGMVAGAEK
ncbi:MAG: raffinose/stachyose/melibiose transport system permease protein [Microbacteriaceae bacterium]|nr:raffinose/stachyose/melibiose transport system permease protein [Microbacteriaceae bacterium]